MARTSANLSLICALALLVPAAEARRQGKTYLLEAALESGAGAVLPSQCRERNFTVSRNGFKAKLPLSAIVVGTSLEVPCGAGTGVPSAAVTFRCVEAPAAASELGCYRPMPSGIMILTNECHWEHVSGSCTDPQDLITTCPTTAWNITWTVGETRTLVSFLLPKTKNPEQQSLELPIPCPAGSPDPKASAKFVCGADGAWREGDASPCAKLTRPAEKPAAAAATGTLPCKLEAKDVALTTGAAGVQIQVQCSQPITNALLKLPNNLQDQAYGMLPANQALVLLTYAKKDFAGRLLLQGTAAGIDGAVEVVVSGTQDAATQAPTTPPPVGPGELPCRLQANLVDLVGGKQGFTVSVLCSSGVEGAILKLPGNYQALSFGNLEPGKRFNLFTHSVEEFGGKAVTLEGKAGGVAGGVSAQVPGAASTAAAAAKPLGAGELPCTLEATPVQLEGNEPGFTVSVRCSQPLSGAYLKLGGGLQDLSFGDIAAGSTFELLTQSRRMFGGKQLVLQASSANGATGSVTVTVPPP